MTSIIEQVLKSTLWNDSPSYYYCGKDYLDDNYEDIYKKCLTKDELLKNSKICSYTPNLNENYCPLGYSPNGFSDDYCESNNSVKCIRDAKYIDYWANLYQLNQQPDINGTKSFHKVTATTPGPIVTAYENTDYYGKPYGSKLLLNNMKKV